MQTNSSFKPRAFDSDCVEFKEKYLDKLPNTVFEGNRERFFKLFKESNYYSDSKK